MVKSMADKMRTAAEWLDVYQSDDEDDGDDIAAQCKDVAEFLRKEAGRREQDADVRSIAKERKVAVAVIRKIIRGAR